MTEPLAEAADIVKFLGSGAGQVQALKGISLTLSGGELTLLMGPSGSGKTTLLSIIGCMLRPTRGAVRVCGKSTVDLGPEEAAKLRRDHIGFVFQSYHLFPTLTAAENVQLVFDVRGESSARALVKAREALATVGLSHKLKSFPLERVAIARAIAGDAAVILADEPTASLDSENGQAIMRILADIAKEPGRTVLVVSHDPRILPFADRVVYMEDGHIVREERTGAGLSEKSEVERAVIGRRKR
jgi:putative ABC transport system ATP-binding protein